MSRKLAIAILIIIVILTSILALAFLPGAKPVHAGIDRTAVEESYRLLADTPGLEKVLYREYIKDAAIDYSISNSEGELFGDSAEGLHGYDGRVKELAYTDTAVYEVEAGDEGFYNIKLDYFIADQVLNNLTLDIRINGSNPFVESRTIDVPIRWKDESKQFTLDSYGDESLPNQVKISEWTTLDMYNNVYDTAEPLLFKLNKGKNTIEITNVSSGTIYLGRLFIAAPENIPAYDEYIKLYEGGSPEEYQFVNAIDYVEKNSSYIRMSAHQSPSVAPFDPVNKKINIIDGMGWRTAGKEITYEVDIKHDGFYQIAFHYMNNKEDFSVFRTIKIDGEIPFREMKSYEFEYTGGDWSNKILSSRTSVPYKFFFTQGKHRISFRSENENVSKSLSELQLLIDHINRFSLEIRKITGKDIDRNRTWKLTRYIPETAQYLDAYETVIRGIIDDLQIYAPNGPDSSTLSYLNKAIVKLDKMQEKPDELPLYFEELYSGSGSVTQMLGDTIDRLLDEALYLDGFYIFNGTGLKKANAGFFDKVKAGISSFTATFTSPKYVIREDKDALNIWVSRPITYIDIMQKMVDSGYTASKGRKVKISVMPDANKLILANAARQSPDIAIGLPSYMPYDLAVRGAAYDLTQFDDFWLTARRSAPGAFIPYILNDSVYAFPETLDFNALVYRKDVFNSLGLDVPDTWQDVLELLPSLQRYGMNFYHPISGGGGLKWFYQTSPFIFQYNGSLYKEDGLSTAINSPEAVKGISFLANLFTTYSLPEQVPSFYNSFRYNILPIGIVDLNTYLQLKNAAPELKGQWELAPNPGIRNENGEILRYFIANGTNAMIMKLSDKPKESWDFIKWWTSAEVQSEYAHRLQSTFGPEYVWLSGNLEAVRNAPIDAADKKVILDQIKWLRDVPRTPGQYMLERGLSDVWSRATQNGMVPRVAIDQQTIIINREIRRKLIEFGYLDEQGRKVKPYAVRDIDWVIEQMGEHNEH